MIKSEKLRRIAAYFLKPSLHVAIIAAAGFIVHFPALPGQFIWDDEYLVGTNPLIKSPLFVFEVFRHHLFLDSYSAHYRPVQDLSYMVDYAIWNGNSYGFHLSNVLLHLGSAILLYFLLRKILASLLGAFPDRDQAATDNNAKPKIMLAAFLVALLWAVHPVHSAAVDYISGRADSLAFIFASAGWLLFIKARNVSRKSFRYSILAGAWLFGLLALCSRETACLWLLIFLIYLFGFDRSVARPQKWMALIACLVLLGTYLGLRQLPESRSQMQPSNHWPLTVRAALMSRALGDYGLLMIFPGNLHMERTVFDPQSFRGRESRFHAIGLEYLSLFGALVFGALAFGALKPGRTQRMRLFGAAWFLLSYLPVSNLVDLNATVAEHWLYLPSVGFLIFLAGIALSSSVSWRRASVTLACFAVFGLGIRSYIRSGDWITSEVFAQRTFAAGGATVRVALLLGQAYQKHGDYAKAEGLYRQALQLAPDYPMVRDNLAETLVHLGRKKEAEDILAAATVAADETRKNYPRTWASALHLAHLLSIKGNDTEAIAVLEKARCDYPKTWELINAESELLRKTGRLDEAIALIRPFANRNWWHFGAALALGSLEMQKGDITLANAALRHASWLDVHDVQALNLIARLQLNQNRTQEAYDAQRRAVSRQPDEPRQYLLLSSILDKMGRDQEAQAQLDKASRLQELAAAVAVN